MSDPGPTSASGEADGSKGPVCRTKHSSTFKVKAAARRKSKTDAYIAAMNEAGIIDLHINQTEDERTTMAKKTGRSKLAQFQQKVHQTINLGERLGLRNDNSNSSPQAFQASQEQNQTKGAICTQCGYIGARVSHGSGNK